MIQLTKDLVLMADSDCYTVGKPRTRADKGCVLDKPNITLRQLKPCAARWQSRCGRGWPMGALPR